MKETAEEIAIAIVTAIVIVIVTATVTVSAIGGRVNDETGSAIAVTRKEIETLLVKRGGRLKKNPGRIQQNVPRKKKKSSKIEVSSALYSGKQGLSLFLLFC